MSAVPDFKAEEKWDPTLCLETDFMTDLVSGLDTSEEEDEELREEHHNKLIVAVGKASSLVGNKKISVWEVRQKGFRSTAVRESCIIIINLSLHVAAQCNALYRKLDEMAVAKADKIKASKSRETKRKGTHIEAHRVNLGTKNNLPPSSIPFAFMVDEEWFEEYADQDSFQVNEDEPDGYNEKFMTGNGESS